MPVVQNLRAQKLTAAPPVLNGIICNYLVTYGVSPIMKEQMKL